MSPLIWIYTVFSQVFKLFSMHGQNFFETLHMWTLLAAFWHISMLTPTEYLKRAEMRKCGWQKSLFCVNYMHWLVSDMWLEDISIVTMKWLNERFILKLNVWSFLCCRTCFSKVRYRRPSFRPQFTSTLAFKSIQMTYSLKPLHPRILNFICSMIRLQGFRIIKFSRIEIPRWTPLLKIAKVLKLPFSPERLGIFGWNFVWSICRTFCWLISKWKNSVAELGHNGRLKIYVDPKKFTLTCAFKFISSKWLGIFGWNFVWCISKTLILIDMKMRKI